MHSEHRESNEDQGEPDYVFLTSPRPTVEARKKVKRVRYNPRKELLTKEVMSHGTSINSLFLLLILAAMISVPMSEIAIHQIEPTIPRYGLFAIYIAMVLCGMVISIGVAAFQRLSMIQTSFQVLAGMLVGLSAATLVVVPKQSLDRVTIATCICSLILVLVASLSARWKIASRLEEGMEQDELERVDA